MTQELNERNELNRVFNCLVEYQNQSKHSSQALLSKDQKIKTLELWQCFAENIIAIESIVEETSGNIILNTPQKNQAFKRHLSAFLTAYRFALQFIEVIEQDPRLVKLLEQKNASLGLGSSAYKYFKFHFLNIKIATRLSALLLINKTNNYDDSEFQKKIEEDKQVIYQYAKKDGMTLTLKNAKNILKTGSFKAWFPIQKSVANTIGNIKVWRNGQSLISLKQVDELIHKMQPGDILLERREWQATNVGIPGFWSHAALFIGSQSSQKTYFNDAEVIKWVKSKNIESGVFSDLLNKIYPEKYQQSLIVDDQYERTVIEALAPGVVFNSLQQSFACDSAVVLRPNLSKLEKAKAIFNAYYYVGLPYDYNFNFQKDDAIVCSELIYKAFQKSDNQNGLNFPLKNIAGRSIMPANEIAKMFAEELSEKKQQLDMVVFLDGNESENKAKESTQAEFIKSWKRPKWHVFLDEEVQKK